MVHKNTSIQLMVIKSEQLDDTTMSVYFERPIGFEFEAGDWIDINFPGEKIVGGITYSLSSSPTENELMITFRKGLSPFKRKLQSVEPSESMYISQYGNDYGFHLNEHKASVLVAGGIGIAPFRSMLKELYDVGSNNSVQLIYLNKGDNYVFGDELKQWQMKLPHLSIVFIDTKELNRKKREKLLISIIDKNAHHYFIAGPENMVESTEHLLLDAGIPLKDIRIDSFGGY